MSGSPRWRQYEHWGSITSVTSKSGSDSISGLSRSLRCFQAKDPVGEEQYPINYFAGTSNFTPGPGTYEHPVSLTTSVYKRPVVSSFGLTTSNRLLNESQRAYALPDKVQPPGPGAYNVLNPTTEAHLKSTLAVTRWKLQVLKEKEKDKESLPIEKKKAFDREYKEEYMPLKLKIKSIKQALAQIEEAKLQHKPLFPIAKKPPFTSTSRRWHQEKVCVQEAPTFYRSPSGWDFGSETRARSPTMSTFGYAEKLGNDISAEALTVPVIIGEQRPKSRCRDTELFGFDTASQMTSPPVGGYSPVLGPPSGPRSKIRK